ncbi:hypothetical protein TNCV_3759941, partial [Trichonephila clavipes]
NSKLDFLRHHLLLPLGPQQESNIPLVLYTQPTYTTDYQERLEAWANWAWSLGLYRSLVLFSTEPYDDDWDKFND